MSLKFIKVIGLLFVLLLTLLTVGIVPGFAQQDSVSADSLQVQGTAVVDSDSYAYSHRGRRDPFNPLVQKKDVIVGKISGRSAKVKGPLEKFELTQYRLVALLVIKGNPRAMVKGPDGKGYTVSVGDYIGINDGIVKNIETKVVDIDENGMRIETSPDRIVVEEVGIDTLTDKKVKEYRYIVM